MIVLQAKGLSKSYGIQNIFSNVSFSLHKGEKIGLIGANGTGKSTLLRCLTGEEVPDQGDIYINDQATLGYLAQNSVWNQEMSLFEELLMGFKSLEDDRKLLRELEHLMSGASGQYLEELMGRYALVTERYERSGGYSCEAMVKRVAKGLGFHENEFLQPVNTMSGGQKTRASLAKVLLANPDILLLDEPTNHLDINAVEWLEEFIASYSQTVLIVSHDRYFLDKTVTGIMELENRKIISYNKNYQGYLQKKSETAISYQRAYEKQQKMIAKTEEFIRRNRAGVKAKQARGRETILARIERLEMPLYSKTLVPLKVTSVPESGQMVLEVFNLGHSYGDKLLFSNLDFLITKGEKVALVGENGTGKSTILKAVVGKVNQDQGQINLGSRVKIGYFSQQHENLNLQNTILYEIMYSFDKGEEEARTLLAGFLFRGQDVEKTIAHLSGGERSRVALLKLLLTGANFLVLDEPTNHLDIPSKEVVEDYLEDFPGTVFLVSHDRYFLDKVVDRIIELHDGKLTEYLGNYSYYRYKKKENKFQEVKKPLESPHRNNRSKVKEYDRTLKKIIKEIDCLEVALEQLENKKDEFARHLSDPSSYMGDMDVKTLVLEFQALEEEINYKYSCWEALLEEKERLENSKVGSDE
ncbi:MAG: ABC-F family ATP-binding cassette domain-containing protein [Bacillota bacterium]